MRKQLIAGVFGLLTGCAGGAPSASYYVLDLPDTAPQAVHLGQQPVLVVDRVQLPDYLNDVGIAFQQDDVQVVTANQARWAEALDKQLSRSLIRQLSAGLNGWQVVDGSASPNDWRLSLELSGFQGRYDGQALVSGRWVLRHGTLVSSQAFQELIPQSADGYPALVRALRQGWQQAVSQLSSQIKTIAASQP